MGILSGNPKHEPMHYGEVFSVWHFLMAEKAALVTYQTFYNHAGDADLRKFIVEKNELRKEIIEKLEELCKENSIQLPPGPAERSEADLESIPVGARFQDPEIAAAIAVDIAAGLVTCSKIIGMSIREDIGTMFLGFHGKAAAYGARMLRMQKEKGWLVPPPLHMKKPE
ncbi:MAG: DUF3231 family protein [Tumebacillaceae bacterium]